MGVALKTIKRNQTGQGRGGRRPGSGRKKGSATKRTREIADKAAESGITPLEFMLDVMRGKAPDNATPAQLIAFTSLRFEAARAAAPYVHPKLAAIEHTGKGGGPIQANVTHTPDEAYKRMLGSS